MCPLWPLHYLLLYAVMLWPLLLLSCGVVKTVAAQVRTAQPYPSMYSSAPNGNDYLNVQYDEVLLGNGSKVNLYGGTGLRPLPLRMDETVSLKFNISGLGPDDILGSKLYVEAAHQHIADVKPKEINISTSSMNGPSSWGAAFNISANLLGRTEVCMRLRKQGKADRFSDCLPVVVTRPQRVIDKVFTASVATLVAIIFINFGCALDWQLVKKTVMRPVGPAIGFTSQYIVLPLISFGLAKILFPDSVALQLGMFFTAISPGGGASNIWTYLLGGNLNLSIAMTTISTLMAFGMMPMWIFTLGREIITQSNEKHQLTVPYARVLEVAFALVVPVIAGLLIQKYLPKLSKILVRILKPFSTLLILFIVVFAIITNVYIFSLFSWEIVVAGLGLPWLGYLTGLLLALAFRQPINDVTAISVETGVHNTGISIFMLRATLDQPEADLTTVIPVAVAIMTPIPLTIWYVVKQLKSRWTVKKNQLYNLTDEETAPVTVNQNEPLTVITAKGASNNNHDKY